MLRAVTRRCAFFVFDFFFFFSALFRFFFRRRAASVRFYIRAAACCRHTRQDCRRHFTISQRCRYAAITSPIATMLAATAIRLLMRAAASLQIMAPLAAFADARYYRR